VLKTWLGFNVNCSLVFKLRLVTWDRIALRKPSHVSYTNVAPAIAKMRFTKFILYGLGLFIGLILIAIYIGIPTIQDRYLEQETKTAKFIAFQDSLTQCEINVRPEVLDRLLVAVKFDHINDGQEIVKDLKIKIEADGKEQERIFDISIAKFIEKEMRFDEARINDFNELTLNSKYRDFSFIIQPQFKLDNKDKFELKLKVILADTLTGRERTIDKIFKVTNDKEFKLEKFGGH
jgi:hypothetical protein